MAGKCNATPGPSAANLKLAFKPIAITGGTIDAVGPGKSATGLTEIRFVPGSTNEFFVSQKAARLNHFRLEGNNAVLVRRFTVPAVFAEEDCGLISFAFDPDYQNNKHVYAAFCTTANKSKVVRYTVGETLTEPVDIIDFSEPSNTSAFHSMGSLGFDRDKNMWLLHGEFYNANNAQNLSSTMGKLLRFVPGKTGGAMPVEGNPFAGMAGRSPLIYAYGFRSPWRGYADSKGRYLVGDVGPGTAEELNIVTDARTELRLERNPRRPRRRRRPDRAHLHLPHPQRPLRGRGQPGLGVAAPPLGVGGRAVRGLRQRPLRRRHDRRLRLR